MPRMNPQMQRGIDREIRKAGQLHGQDRRDYKAAQEAGRGKSFMRNFQRDAQQMQEGIAREAAPLGYRPSQPQQQPQQQPQPQRLSQPWSPGSGDMLTNLVNSGGQPMRPIAQVMGQQVDPGHNGWDRNNIDPNRLPTWPSRLKGSPAAASIQGYPGVVNDMMNGTYKPPGMAQGFGGRSPWAPNQRSQTRSPGIGLDGRRINYSR